MIARARALPRFWRIGAIVASAAVVLTAALVAAPIPQDPAYHDFADRRAFWGIPNFDDVVSNLPFLLAGCFGLVVMSLWGAWTERRRDALWMAFAVYFAGVALVAFGSAYYHRDPTSATLFWDRLPMTIAFMALFAAIITDRIAPRAGWVVLPTLIVFGLASVVYWHLGEQAGRGDLRFYAVVQFFPMLAIPLICFLFPPRRLDGRYLVPMFLFYALAKLVEHFDGEIFALFDFAISGHTMKHFFAAAAALMALPMLRSARDRAL